MLRCSENADPAADAKPDAALDLREYRDAAHRATCCRGNIKQMKLERYQEGCAGAAPVEAFTGFLSAFLDQER
jgi:hypothetical protein